jgi:hypothetical protein
MVESVTSAVALVSGLMSAVSKLSALEAKQLVLDLQNMLGKIQAEAFELQHQNNDLHNRIRELEEQAKARGQVIREDNFVWLERPDGSKDGPFCSVCCDESNQTRFIHLTPGATKGTFGCGVCQGNFRSAEYSPSITRPLYRA